MDGARKGSLIFSASSAEDEHRDAARLRSAAAICSTSWKSPSSTSITGGEAGPARAPAQRQDGSRSRSRSRRASRTARRSACAVRGSRPPRGSSPGDLLITVRVAPHPHFRRHGNDLEVLVPVTLAEAALARKIDVPTPQGTITLTVPPGTSGGRRLRVKGRGIATGKGPPGDLYAELRIVLPKEIDEETARADPSVRCPLPAPSASRSAMVAHVLWLCGHHGRRCWARRKAASSCVCHPRRAAGSSARCSC